MSGYVRPHIDSRFIKGIICLESASCYWGLSMYPPLPIKIYTTYKNQLVSKTIFTVPVKYMEYENAIELGDRLYVTDRERTVIDLILRNGSEEFKFDSLSSYIRRFGLMKLVEYVDERGFITDERGLYPKLVQALRDMKEYYIDTEQEWLYEFDKDPLDEIAELEKAEKEEDERYRLLNLLKRSP
jgi:hypothetical protein